MLRCPLRQFEGALIQATLQLTKLNLLKESAMKQVGASNQRTMQGRRYNCKSANAETVNINEYVLPIDLRCYKSRSSYARPENLKDRVFVFPTRKIPVSYYNYVTQKGHII